VIDVIDQAIARLMAAKDAWRFGRPTAALAELLRAVKTIEGVRNRIVEQQQETAA
jgi:hypothetical protein